MCTPLRTVGYYPGYNQNVFGEYDDDMAPTEDNDPESNEIEPPSRLTLAEEEAETTLKYTGFGSLWGGIIGGVGGCLSGAGAGSLGGPPGMIAGCLAGGISGGVKGSQIGAAVGAATGVVRGIVEQSAFDPKAKDVEKSYQEAKRWGTISDRTVQAGTAIYGGYKTGQAIKSRYNNKPKAPIRTRESRASLVRGKRPIYNTNASTSEWIQSETPPKPTPTNTVQRESRASLVKGKRPIYNTNASTSQAIQSARGPRPPPIKTNMVTRSKTYISPLGERLPIPDYIDTTKPAIVGKPLKNVVWNPNRNAYVTKPQPTSRTRTLKEMERSLAKLQNIQRTYDNLEHVERTIDTIQKPRRPPQSLKNMVTKPPKKVHTPVRNSYARKPHIIRKR